VIESPAGNNTNEFDLIAFGETSLWPFVAVQCETVVFNEDSLRSQLKALHQFLHGGSPARVDSFTIDRDFHPVASA
jgi:hypothetical protein